LGRRGIALGLVLLAAAGCANVGGPRPDAPAHHRERGFANTNPEYAPPGRWTRTTFFVRRILASTFRPRTFAPPVVANDGRALRANPTAPAVTWVGHATLLVQLDGVNLLTDPHWSERASPVRFAGPRRLVPPGLAFDALPPIHLVLISHDHYDHLDVDTVRRLAEVHRPLFLVPLGLEAWFADHGIDDVVELDWWDRHEVRGLVVTGVPAQHFSARSLWDRNRRLWSGWTVAGHDRRFYFAGDTAHYDGLKEIGERLGPFDLAAIPIGAYEPREMMRMSHTTPEEALDVLADVGGRHLVPIHWGTFDLADEPPGEPPVRLAAEAARRQLPADRVWILRHGETRRW
jgi:N-acyl-phosphatidylethanolamine-hydrolysing phospholipase D